MDSTVQWQMKLRQKGGSMWRWTAARHCMRICDLFLTALAAEADLKVVGVKGLLNRFFQTRVADL